jgi:hypothetical protein
MNNAMMTTAAGRQRLRVQNLKLCKSFMMCTAHASFSAVEPKPEPLCFPTPRPSIRILLSLSRHPLTDTQPPPPEKSAIMPVVAPLTRY